MEKEGGAVLRAQHIRKEFNERVILEDVSFSIERGEIFGLIGISGSGKTTLLHLFVGFYEPEEGDIFITHNGAELLLGKNLTLARKRFGFAPQHPSFYPKLTVQENLEHFGILYGLGEEELEQQIETLLSLTKLDKSLLADQLSYGMQKRLGIACALVHNPSILLLDEPTADLDPLMRKDIWKLVKRINELGTTIIIASHILGEMENMCARIGMLHAGKMAFVGTFEEMKEKYCPRQEITIKTASRLYEKLIARLKGKGTLSSMNGQQLQLLTSEPEKMVDALVQHVKSIGDKIEYLHVSPPSLDELFALIEGKKEEEE